MPRPAPGQCSRLGDRASNTQLSVFPWNPARGLTLNFTQGDMCTNTWGGQERRALRVALQCIDQSKALFNGSTSTNDDIIMDASQCSYTALVQSQAACPTGCLAVSGGPGQRGLKLCNQRGICDYDGDPALGTGRAKCFCNVGWSGNACTFQGDAGLPAPTSYTGTVRKERGSKNTLSLSCMLPRLLHRVCILVYSLAATLQVAAAFFGGIVGGVVAVALAFGIKAKVS